MNEVTQYTERLQIVLNPDASIKVIEITNALAIDGTVVSYSQIGMNALSDPAVADILTKCSAVAVVERDSLAALLQSTVEERDIAERKVATLTAELDQLRFSISAQAAVPNDGSLES
jgi:hypothetical protein